MSHITNAENILNFLAQNGNLDLAFVQEQIEMQKRKEILENHTSIIWEGKDKYWRTYLPNNNGRKLIKRKEKKDVEDIVVQYWKSQFKKRETFNVRYEAWIKRQEIKNVSGNTLTRYKSDYKKYFEQYPIINKIITSITDEDIYIHLKQIISDYNPTFKTVKTQFGYIKGVFEKSILDKLLTVADNPCQYVDIDSLKSLCREEKCQTQTIADRTISKKEVDKLLYKMYHLDPRNKHPNLVAYKAIEFAMLTGMRVGELSGLKWEDIDTDVIIIRHSEKYDRITKEYSIKNTKNNKIRYLPLTDDMKYVLNATKELEEKNGWLGEFVFMNAGGRVHCRTISDCIRNLTMSQDYERTKSIHAIRRTVNSKMRCNGVSSQVASSLIGNTKEVNENHYSYNIEEYEKQKEYVEAARLFEIKK